MIYSFLLTVDSIFRYIVYYIFYHNRILWDFTLCRINTFAIYFLTLKKRVIFRVSEPTAPKAQNIVDSWINFLLMFLEW